MERVGIELRFAGSAGSGRDIHLAADDRLDPNILAVFIERDGPVHNAVVGKRERRHSHFSGFARQVFQPASAVQEAKFGVCMKVYEFRLAHRGKESRRPQIWRFIRMRRLHIAGYPSRV